MNEEFELISVPKELLEALVRRILTEYISLSTPEPDQDEEPFGYVEFIEDAGLNFCTLEPTGDYPYQPIYLYPAPRKPFVRLSEEDIIDITSGTVMPTAIGIAYKDAIRFARAIEDALEEKNNSTIPSLNDINSANSRISGHE